MIKAQNLTKLFPDLVASRLVVLTLVVLLEARFEKALDTDIDKMLDSTIYL